MLDELRNSKTQLQNLIDAIPYLVFLMTIDDKYLVANEMFCKFVGFSKDKIIGFTNKDVFSGGNDTVEYLVRDNEKVLSKKCSVNYESIIELDGVSYSLSINKFPYLIMKMKFTLFVVLLKMSHDFNNIIASIMGYTGLTQKRIAEYSDETIDG